MKRSLRLIGLAAFMAVPAVMSAQETTRPVSFGVSGGLSLPVGDFGESLSAGYNVGGHLFFKPASFTNLGFRADATFDRWSLKNQAAGATGNTRVIGVTGNAIYSFPQSSPSVLRPYVLAGVGGFNGKGSASGGGVTIETDSDTNVGAQIGGGINFSLSGFSTFIEAKYVNVFSEGNSSGFIPITFGVRF